MQGEILIFLALLLLFAHSTVGESFTDEFDDDLDDLEQNDLLTVEGASKLADELLSQEQVDLGNIDRPDLPPLSRQRPVLAGAYSEYGNGEVPELASSLAKELGCKDPSPTSGVVRKAITLVKNLVSGCKGRHPFGIEKAQNAVDKAEEEAKEKLEEKQSSSSPSSSSSNDDERSRALKKALRHEEEEAMSTKRLNSELTNSRNVNRNLNRAPIVDDVRAEAQEEKNEKREYEEAKEMAKGKIDKAPVMQDGEFKIKHSSNVWREVVREDRKAKKVHKSSSSSSSSDDDSESPIPADFNRYPTVEEQQKIAQEAIKKAEEVKEEQEKVAQEDEEKINKDRVSFGVKISASQRGEMVREEERQRHTGKILAKRAADGDKPDFSFGNEIDNNNNNNNEQNEEDNDNGARAEANLEEDENMVEDGGDISDDIDETDELNDRDGELAMEEADEAIEEDIE